MKENDIMIIIANDNESNVKEICEMIMIMIWKW